MSGEKCKGTHHTGCACHEAAWKQKVEELEAELDTYVGRYSAMVQLEIELRNEIGTLKAHVVELEEAEQAYVVKSIAEGNQGRFS